MSVPSFDARYASAQLARRDNPLRVLVKRLYLDRILRHVRGATVDVGCGAGQLLERLPAGSIGLETNPALVEALQKRGLDVSEVAADPGRVSLGALQPGAVSTVVLSHVLEHFDDAAAVLRRLITDCCGLGIARLIVVVPGLVGYRSDATHRTFVTRDYLRRHALMAGDDFRVVHQSFFPGNLESLGRLFVYHEWMVVYELAGSAERSRDR